MLDVLKSVGRVAGQDVTVLVRGESGTGKDLVARAIVQHSNRKDFPFVAVNCAAIPDQLLESELFGHEKGAFTGAERRRVGKFEQCDNGSIFLDEVGDMSPLVQGKVLRLLQDQSFQRVGGNEEIRTNVRIVAATNRNLEQMVKDGEFREDLFYRLNGFTIQLPPLRERKEDIPLLLEYFLRRARKEMNKSNLDGLSPKALEMLKDYHWPGNVRQLQSVVRQAVLNTTGTVLGVESLPSIITQARDDRAAQDVSAGASVQASGVLTSPASPVAVNRDDALNGAANPLSALDGRSDDAGIADSAMLAGDATHKPQLAKALSTSSNPDCIRPTTCMPRPCVNWSVTCSLACWRPQVVINRGRLRFWE